MEKKQKIVMIKKYVLLVALCFPIIGFAQNLITNGNFETGNTSSWGGFNNQVLTDDMTNSSVGNVNNGEGSLLQVFTVIPGATYDVTFDYKWVSGSGNYNMTARVKEDASGGSDLGTLVLNSTPNVWQNAATFSFTVPSGISTVRLVFYKVNGNRPLRLDNVSVVDQSSSPPSFVDSNTPTNAQPMGVSGDWTLDFSDEFNDSSLNLSKWYKSVSTQSRAPRAALGVDDWWWVEDNAFLNGSGELVLRGTKIDGNTMYCGSIESRNLYEVQYGYLEARIKIAETAKGNHTAFWLQGHNQSNVDNSAADGAEVDIFESAWNNDISKAVVHYDGYGADQKNHTIPFNTPGIHNGYHTFGLLWTEDEMYVYYDGVQVSSTSSSKPFPFSTNPINGHPLVPNVPEWLWLSVGASFGDGDFISQPVGTLSDALVDYVRIYKPNTTLSTLEAKKYGFQIYPNPVKDFINIKSEETDYDVTIYNTKGKKLLTKKVTDFTTRIDISKYPKGLYFFKVTAKNSSELFKILF
jgi:beta-glucanase (GH16 family)